MTWAEVVEDKFLATLPYRIETDRWGHLVMSPPPRSFHAQYQTEIAVLMRRLLKNGRSIVECPIETSEGVKAADVVWVSEERRKSRPNDPAFLIAPEICVEVESPSNSAGEFMERQRLFFERGAQEFWICGILGDMTFCDPSGQIPQSNLCRDFPKKLSLD